MNMLNQFKCCPVGTKLYSPAFGEVTFEGIVENHPKPIVINHKGTLYHLTEEGKLDDGGEVMIHISKPEKTRQPQYNHGDILVCRNNDGSCAQMFVYKTDTGARDYIECFFGFDVDSDLDDCHWYDGYVWVDGTANEQEVDLFYTKLATRGCWWDKKKGVLQYFGYKECDLVYVETIDGTKWISVWKGIGKIDLYTNWDLCLRDGIFYGTDCKNNRLCAMEDIKFIRLATCEERALWNSSCASIHAEV